MKTYIVLMILLLSPTSWAESIAGHWVWVKNDKNHTLSIKVEESGSFYIGRYCAVGLVGIAIVLSCFSVFLLIFVLLPPILLFLVFQFLVLVAFLIPFLSFATLLSFIFLSICLFISSWLHCSWFV